MAAMLIPAHEYCVLILLALIGRRDFRATIKDPFGKWLVVFWICVATVDSLTLFGKLGNNSIFYFLSGCALSLLIPLAFLFVRKYHLRNQCQPGDARHFIALSAWVVASLVFYFTPVSQYETYRLFYEIFGYCISSTYIFLLLVLYYKGVGQVTVNNKRELPEKTQHFSAAHVQQNVSAIDIVMTSGTSYLQNKYSLGDLAMETGIPTHQLSAFINSHYKMNFNDFINKHRIEYFKKRIVEDPAWQSLTLEGIAKDSGFGNRNTFTRAFKKLHGTTPGEFLNSIRQREAS